MSAPKQPEYVLVHPNWPTCACGCGQPVPAYKKTETRRGWIKGAPAKYVNGHSGGPEPVDWSDIVVTETGCHVFGSYEYPPQGYRRARWNGKPTPIHRMAWERVNGPAGRDHVHHTCENKHCVNLAHLERLTPAEHNARHKKGKPCVRRKTA